MAVIEFPPRRVSCGECTKWDGEPSSSQKPPICSQQTG